MGDIVPIDQTPEQFARAIAGGPSFDQRKRTFHARPIATYKVSPPSQANFLGSPVAGRGHQIFSTLEEEDVRLFAVAVARQTFLGLAHHR